MDLARKLAALAQEMSAAERANYKLLLSMAAGGLIRDGVPLREDVDRLAFSTTLHSISQLQPHRSLVPPDGVVFRGRPSFVTDEVLAALRQESAELRCRAIRFDDHYVARGGPIASEIAVSTELESVLSKYTNYVTPTGRANYLYYDEIGLGIDPHVDNEVFSLNAIMMLEHVAAEPPSALVVYPPTSSPKRIHLSPGEMIVLYADSITHARERMKLNERVRIVAFGFQPIV